MPVAFNPPPLPHPDRATLHVADAAGDATSGDDAFAAALVAARGSGTTPPSAAGSTAATADAKATRAGNDTDPDAKTTDDPGAALLDALQALLPPTTSPAATGTASSDTTVDVDADGAKATGEAPIASLAIALPVTPMALALRPTVAPASAQGRAVDSATVAAAVAGNDVVGRDTLAGAERSLPSARPHAPPQTSASSLQTTSTSAALRDAGPTTPVATVEAALARLATANDASARGTDCATERASNAAHAASGNDVTLPMSADGRAPRVVEIAPAMSSPEWRPAVVQELAQMIVLRHDRAELRLNPADLGPISVQLKVDAGQATLLVTAAQPTTRDALELAIPQLRDTLAQQGITLGQATVQDDARRPPDARLDAPPSAGGAVRSIALVPDAALLTRAARGIIDVYA